MINILPPTVKEERHYGRLNRFILRQVLGLAMIGVIAVGFMLSGLRLVKNDEDILNAAIADKTASYSQLTETETTAKQANSLVMAIQGLFEKEVRFSTLLTDIAASMPLNTRLKSLSLTGSKTQPLQIVAQVDTQNLAAVLRKSLVDSPTFESADILSIVPGETDPDGGIKNYDVTISAEFTGAADARAAEKAKQEAEAEAAKKAATEAQNK
ncbi:hypothetical protein H6798_00340 [Candidatus Nomurabacteria bacterium]|nr:hypothetical protein [Candidatus Nomurabacteria bacterium]